MDRRAFLRQSVVGAAAAVAHLARLVVFHDDGAVEHDQVRFVEVGGEPLGRGGQPAVDQPGEVNRRRQRHLLDRVQGAAHFEVHEETAKRLMNELRARMPGYLVPRLVRETAGAASKQPVC